MTVSSAAAMRDVTNKLCINQKCNGETYRSLLATEWILQNNEGSRNIPQWENAATHTWEGVRKSISSGWHQEGISSYCISAKRPVLDLSTAMCKPQPEKARNSIVKLIFSYSRCTRWRSTLLQHELTASSLGSACQSCTTPFLWSHCNELCVNQRKYPGKSVSLLDTGRDTHTHT